MSLSDFLYDFLHRVETKQCMSLSVERLIEDVERYAARDGETKFHRALVTLGRTYLEASDNETSIQALDDLKTSVEAFLLSPCYEHRKRVIKDGKILVRINKKKEAAQLIRQLERAYDQLVDFQKETGLRLFGLSDVEAGLRYLKKEKSE